MATTDPRTATEGQWSDLVSKVKAKQDQLTAGTGININNNVISATGANITMTNVDPGEGSPLAADNYVAVYGGDPIVMDYSTAEINTGVKWWLDGSTIYKKTIDFGTLPNNTEKTVSHGISNMNLVIRFDATAKSTTTGNNIPLPFVSTTVANQIYLTVSSTNITIGCGTDRSTLHGYITLYYTKSS